MNVKELGQLQVEVRGYTVDSVIRENRYDEMYVNKKKQGLERIDTDWWAKVFAIQERVVVDSQTAFDINVQASETVTLTFFVEGFLKG